MLSFQEIRGRVVRFYLAVKKRLSFLLEEILEEFSPWLKWVILDAFLTLVLRWLAKRYGFLNNLFEAVGWV